LILSERIDAIESGYEFMLAYAAQGRDTDRDSSGSGAGFELREFLQKMEKALDGLGPLIKSAINTKKSNLGASNDFLDAVEEDAKKALGLVRLIMAQPDVSSMLIDNANASIHLRALLTDLFIIDEAFDF
tara:strand:+ start:897 stop:1286 length:390 start_codon:yes stop_codon:yes gene_type:complete